MQKTQLAMFPLEILLLPGETTRLHIFEERYRQLLDDCENIHISFGIPYTKGGYLTGYGCLVELKEVLQRHANGSSDVEIHCTGLFKIDRFYMRMGTKLYPGGEAEIIELGTWPELRIESRIELEEYLKELGGEITPDLFSAELKVLDAARILNLGQEEKLKLIKATTHHRREEILVENIKLQRLMLAQRNSIRGDIFLN